MESLESRVVDASNQMDPTLSSWVKTMDKLSGLIDHLDELASFVPAEHQSQLSRHLATLRTMFKNQQGRGTAFGFCD